MDEYKTRQLNILDQELAKFNDGRISLGSLIGTMESIVPLLEDPRFSDALFPHLVALEEVNARLDEKNFDYDAFGRPVVQKAVGAVRNHVRNRLRRPD
jgi:hypothetical protein